MHHGLHRGECLRLDAQRVPPEEELQRARALGHDEALLQVEVELVAAAEELPHAQRVVAALGGDRELRSGRDGLGALAEQHGDAPHALQLDGVLL
eukprot:9189814-Lingulodinium_polyedra.AAC.1